MSACTADFRCLSPTFAAYTIGDGPDNAHVCGHTSVCTMVLQYSAISNCVGANSHVITAVTEASTAFPHSRCWRRGGGCLAAVAQFSDRLLLTTGGKKRTRGYATSSLQTWSCRPAGPCLCLGHSAAQWQFSPQLKQFLRLEYRSSRGHLSLCVLLRLPMRSPITWSAL